MNQEEIMWSLYSPQLIRKTYIYTYFQQMYANSPRQFLSISYCTVVQLVLPVKTSSSCPYIPPSVANVYDRSISSADALFLSFSHNCSTIFQSISSPKRRMIHQNSYILVVFVLLDLQFYVYVLQIVVCPFDLFLLAIVLSVLL